MTTYTYRGHEITRTNTTTGGSDGKPLRHLFSISKPSMPRRRTLPTSARPTGSG